jgi:hypothetical protein
MAKRTDISFAEHFLPLILSGQKTVTSRLIRNPGASDGRLTDGQIADLLARCPCEAGQRVTMTIGNQPKGDLEIVDVSVKRVDEFSQAQAIQEGFEDVQSFCNELAGIYGAEAVSGNALMWVVAFKLL